ncbi:MAG: indolepyruvate ferredoxin oxidoreductase family protein [Hyphomicrobiaceae bacterium]
MPKAQASRPPSLSDKFDLALDRQLLTGTQAVVRLALMQKERDRRAGLDTAGYVSGYRGSPIASLEGAFQRVGRQLDANDIVFHPGLNEDLAATAIWGSQQAELRGEGKYDGVFAIWYGKGPGVDRTGDVFRHANHAGTSKHGGVLALMGDDHTCESSTSAHQSEFAMVDFMIPVLNPAGVQEILDYGLLGFALSRYAGIWVGLKCVKDNIESTAAVDGRLDRVEIAIPSEDQFRMPAGGLNIRMGDQALDKEARLHDYKRPAILAFARANKLDRQITSGGPDARIGIITTGKSYLDVREAMENLGIDEVAANELGLRLYKVAMTWPLEPEGVARFAEGLDLILVVEEKRSLIETQVKEQLFDTPNRPSVLGKKDEQGNWLFPAKGALDPTDIAVIVGERLIRAGRGGEALKEKVARLRRVKGNKPTEPSAFTRTPYFCAGCPHNSSTKVPDGSRAYAGIGCHYMVQWMDRATEGFTQMGGEGVNWVGEAPFSKRGHVFQNLGDGTYIHSGSLAIRAAVAARTNVTFKVLYNDAVAMTGGQALDGNLTVPQLARQLVAEGVGKVAVVSDEPDKYGPRVWPLSLAASKLPAGVTAHHRRDLMAVQKDLAATPGVTAMIYDQTCAAEKRRRRKRGTFPDPDRRVFINTAVCEGCGDCGVKSNCVAVLPKETAFGRKREIDQSACNKDFSCLEGFCPSFVTLDGAKVRKAPSSAVSVATGALEDRIAALPAPALPDLSTAPYAMIVTGIGGTGVVTISAVLAQAAHIEGKGFGSIDMTGLAQKGGAVACHMRVAASPDGIHAIRVGVGGADVIVGGDLVVTASNKILEAIEPDETAVIVSTYEMTTGDFTRNPTLTVPGLRLKQAIRDRVRSGPLTMLDAHDIAVKLFGDSIAANMLLLGVAHQLGHVPIGAEAIEEAIRLNGAAVEMNLAAFGVGRLAANDPTAVEAMAGLRPEPSAPLAPGTLAEIVDARARHLAAYQDDMLAARYREKVGWIERLERERAPGGDALARAVASAYHKLLAYKDEYEVARLYTDGTFEAEVKAGFEGVRAMRFHLAPPFLAWAWKDKVTGHPRKVTLGPWVLPLLRLLARGKHLRGTAFDLFGRTAERRLERRMIADYEILLDRIAVKLGPSTHATAVQLAALPMDVKGFGHVKLAAHRRAQDKERALLAELEAPAPVRMAAE